MSKHLPFRPDIEGLRALVVLTVLAFDTHHLSVAAANYIGRKLKMAYGDIFSQIDTQKSVVKENETNH